MWSILKELGGGEKAPPKKVLRRPPQGNNPGQKEEEKKRGKRPKTPEIYPRGVIGIKFEPPHHPKAQKSTQMGFEWRKRGALKIPKKSQILGGKRKGAKIE